MDYINESLKTPVFGEYDVVVAGAGPAGVCAAIAAARNGAKTLLIERYGFLGGMWSAGFIIPLFDFENKHYIVSEIVNELKARGGWGGYYDNPERGADPLPHLPGRSLLRRGGRKGSIYSK